MLFSALRRQLVHEERELFLCCWEFLVMGPFFNLGSRGCSRVYFRSGLSNGRRIGLVWLIW